ncbi:MAG TPA: hypothetical protein VLT87_11120 [Thermoanaerobaculia bacterium]|nr:hypothetical protein [Thermoanaerobaculia bacterium]
MTSPRREKAQVATVLDLCVGHPKVSDDDIAEALASVATMLTDEWCSAPWNGYGCTRPPGHAGIHVASGGLDPEEIYAIWREEGA